MTNSFPYGLHACFIIPRSKPRMFRRSIAMSLKEFSARSKTVWESSRKDTRSR